MEAIFSSVKSVLSRAIRSHIPEDGILNWRCMKKIERKQLLLLFMALQPFVETCRHEVLYRWIVRNGDIAGGFIYYETLSRLYWACLMEKHSRMKSTSKRNLEWKQSQHYSAQSCCETWNRSSKQQQLRWQHPIRLGTEWPQVSPQKGESQCSRAALQMRQWNLRTEKPVNLARHSKLQGQ
jgi:hypothetical protein